MTTSRSVPFITLEGAKVLAAAAEAEALSRGWTVAIAVVDPTGGVADVDDGVRLGVVGSAGFGRHAVSWSGGIGARSHHAAPAPRSPRAASAAARTTQPSTWSLTSPIACMKA